MLQFHLVAVYVFAIEFTINLMQVYAMTARKQRAHFEKVGAYFIDIARLAGIVAGCLNAARERRIVLKARYIVGLPAVK